MVGNHLHCVGGNNCHQVRDPLLRPKYFLPFPSLAMFLSSKIAGGCKNYFSYEEIAGDRCQGQDLERDEGDRCLKALVNV